MQSSRSSYHAAFLYFWMDSWSVSSFSAFVSCIVYASTVRVNEVACTVAFAELSSAFHHCLLYFQFHFTSSF